MTDEFFSKHIDTFLNEASTHIDNMNSSLIKLKEHLKAPIYSMKYSDPRIL